MFELSQREDSVSGEEGREAASQAKRKKEGLKPSEKIASEMLENQELCQNEVF